MRRVAVINQCGGVGKTTIATSLGHALAVSGRRVTLIDLDPKGGLSAGYGLFRAPTKGIDRVMLNGTDLSSVKIGARDLLTLIPAGITLAQMERREEGGLQRMHRLQEVTAGQFADQAFVLFDCPSNSGLIALNALVAADELLIPVTSGMESLNGAMKILLALKRLQPYIDHPVVTRIVLNRFNPRHKTGREMLQKLQRHFPEALLSSAIRESEALPQCMGMGRTIYEFKAGSHSAREFQALAGELIALGGAGG